MHFFDRIFGNRRSLSKDEQALIEWARIEKVDRIVCEKDLRTFFNYCK
ncbi:hypothetical protein [Butyrivibrio sp. CB08]|nr:hypothetical protein [Butyrivibrio sp. CB08]